MSSYQTQLTYKNLVNFNKAVEASKYRRNHPFRSDWSDWRNTVFRFYSPRISYLQKCINKGYRNFSRDDVDVEEMYMIDEIQYLCDRFRDDLSRIKNKENYREFAYQLFKRSVAFACADFYECCNCYCIFPDTDLFDNKCTFALLHLQAHCIAFMWAMYYTFSKPDRKRVLKYYHRLEKVILSLSYDHLSGIDFRLIFHPFDYLHFKNSLLINLYERFYFEKWSAKSLGELPFIFEYMKNFNNNVPVSQGGRVACQSFSDTPFLKKECIALLYDFALNRDFDDIVRIFSIKSQGLLSMSHDLNISDESVEKLRGMLNESKDSFMADMKDTLMCVGEKLGAMFIVAATCSLITRFAVGLGLDILMKMLHTIYLFVTGGLYTKEIKHSLAISQSGSEVSIPFLPTMILNYIIKPPPQILAKIWKSPNIDTIMRRIGFLGDIKVDRGIERIIEWIQNIIRKIQQWYGQDVLGMYCGIQGLYESEENPVLTWYKNVDELCNTYLKGDFRWTELEFQIVLNTYKQGLSFIRNAEFIKYKHDVHQILRQLVTIMEKFKQKGINNQNIRNPPVTIYLYGDTGVGKSSITYPLAVEILKKIHDTEGSSIDLKKEWKNMIYMRAPEQEYWDGYENQLVTVFDDFSQQADSLQNPNIELFEIIRSSNCFPYPLHMASLDQKANTNFTSKIIIVSSNLKNPQCASLNFPEALRRRFDICVKIDRKFTGHTNYFDPKAYILEQYDMISGNPIKNITYQDFVGECVSSYFSRKTFVNAIEQYIDGILSVSEEVVLPQSQGGTSSVSDQQGEIESPEQQFNDANRPSTSQIVNQLLESHVQQHVNRRVQELIKEESIKTGIEPGLLAASFQTPQMVRYKSDENSEWWSKAKDPFWLLSYYVCTTIDKTKVVLESHWQRFKAKHPYLAKAAIAISMITVGLTFLKIFFMFGNMCKGSNLLTEGEVVKRTRVKKTSVSEAVIPKTSVPKVESYTAVKTAIPKVESYTPVKAQIPKIESYTPVIPRVAKVEGPELPTSEGVKDINATEILLKVVRTNLYKMHESTKQTVIGHVLFLKGKVAVMPKHFLNSFYQSLRNDPEAYVYFENAFLDRTFNIKIKDLLTTKIEYESPNEDDGPVLSRDLMCFNVKTSIYHSDATNYFVTRGSMSRVDSSEVMLPILVNNNSQGSSKACLLIRYAKGRSQLECVERLPVTDDSEVVARYVRKAYMYNLDTQETECGAPLIVRNTLIQPGKICGLHIAGISGTGQGWSTVLYREDVVKILSLFDPLDQLSLEIRTPMGEFPKEQGKIPESAQFRRLGTFSQKISQPRKSKIIPSPLYGKIKEPTTRPCLLTQKEIDGKIFDPRVYRLGRLGNVPLCLDETMIGCAKDALIDEISSTFDPDSVNENCKSVYSFEEACCGIDGEPYINSIKRDTSSGFPFVLMNNFTRKDIFGTGEEYNLKTTQCEILRNRVNTIIDNAKQGIAIDHIFIDTLKDERKSIEKSHKTRLFSAGPIDYLIACKMYFNGIVNLLSKNRNRCHISVGTNVYSNDWDYIARLLHLKSKRVIAGDFEGFDASQHQRMLESSLEVLIELSKRFCGTSESDALIMWTLGVNLFNSVHIMEDLIYQWTHSLPSGHYLTAIINSIFVNLAFGCIWQLYKKKFSYKTARSFWLKCGIVAYGDDHLVTVPVSESDFNQFTVPKFMEKIGLSYTLEDKDTEVSKPYRLITEVTYLKRRFLFDPNLNRYICPLNLDTVLEFPMWNHKCPDQITQTIVELEKCIEELSLHEKVVWDKFIGLLKDCGRSLGFYTDKVNQEDTRNLALGQFTYL